MTSILSRLLEEVPAPINADALWSEAVSTAARAGTMRSRSIRETPAERMRRMRETLQGELVAFHDTLIVSPYRGDLQANTPGASLWDVRVPLTLFPKRDHGFSRVECLVEFSNDGGGKGLRVVALEPAPRTEVVARAEMGGTLELKTKAKLGIPVPLPAGMSVADAAGSVYAKAEAGPFVYRAVRSCVLTEIMRGTGARWRLDDARNPEQVGVESHDLGVVLEVAPGTGPVHAAGYLEAHSDMGWMSADLGSVWTVLAQRIKDFFQRGAPAEAYAEWEGILTGRDASAG